MNATDFFSSISELKNTYYVMRHGLSIPNEKHIIISRPENGIKPEHGLTKIGEEQSKDSAEKSGLGSNTTIYSSDFSRALQTAEIVKEVISAPNITIDTRLRERYFGELEGKSIGHYKEFWDTDKNDTGGKLYGAESVNELANRLDDFLRECETNNRDQTILLVSHGDTLRIFEALVREIDLSENRRIPTLDNAEIRKIGLSTS
jgi:glucosyl-3-phosphoglycerate phosphatase